MLTNYTNNVARTVVYFPKVKVGEFEPATAIATPAPIRNVIACERKKWNTFTPLITTP